VAHCYRCSMTSLLVSLLGTTVCPTKTAQLIEMPFEVLTRVGAGNFIIDGGSISPGGRLYLLWQLCISIAISP